MMDDELEMQSIGMRNGKKRVRRQGLERQAGRLRARLAAYQRRSDQLSRLRLAVFALGVVASAFALLNAGIWPWIGVTFLAAIPFFTAVYFHRQIETTIRRTQIWLNIKETHIARMTLDWDRIPAAQPVPPRFDHPFALDLDLIGDRSVHQLLDTAVTLEGSQRLRDWLLAGEPDAERIAYRRKLVQELAGLPLFRDKLGLNTALVGAKADDKWPGQQLLDWLDKQTERPSFQPILLVLLPLAVLNIVLGALNFAGILPPLWMATWLVYMVISMAQLRRIGPIFHEAFFLRDGLDQLRATFDFLERYRYGRNPALRTLCQPFLGEGERPSHHLRRIGRVVAAVGLQKNPFVWLALNAIIPWDIYFARRLSQCKRDLRTLLPAWLDVWFELEALNSIAAYAYLNPDTVYPEIETETVYSFQAIALGHPLIPDKTRICNDFMLEKVGYIALITGSNMSGKSSFLRALGVNLALAYAGGPVLAQSLQTALFRLYSSIRISDSVTDGFSYFYAEVQRLQALLDSSANKDALPLFFLIDEIFRGTNNRERLIGSRAYIQALAASQSLGAIATHDLELVSLANDLPGLQNYHFRDDVKDGRMIFDYQLRPGPCPTTNALKIMRLAGLPIP